MWNKESQFSLAYPDVANSPTVKQSNRPTDPEMENRPTGKQANGQIGKWTNGQIGLLGPAIFINLKKRGNNYSTLLR